MTSKSLTARAVIRGSRIWTHHDATGAWTIRRSPNPFPEVDMGT